MSRMPRFKIIPPSRFDRRKNKPSMIQDTKKDRRGRKPIFTMSNLGGSFDLQKRYRSTNRTTYAFSFEPKKQARMLNIRKAKK